MYSDVKDEIFELCTSLNAVEKRKLVGVHFGRERMIIVPSPLSQKKYYTDQYNIMCLHDSNRLLHHVMIPKRNIILIPVHHAIFT